MRFKQPILKKLGLLFIVFAIVVPALILAEATNDLPSWNLFKNTTRELWPRQSNGTVASTSMCFTNFSTSTDYFIPNKTQKEIESFIFNLPPNVTQTTPCCANTVCDSAGTETYLNCIDCPAPSCGDSTCDPSEIGNCTADCPDAKTLDFCHALEDCPNDHCTASPECVNNGCAALTLWNNTVYHTPCVVADCDAFGDESRCMNAGCQWYAGNQINPSQCHYADFAFYSDGAECRSDGWVWSYKSDQTTCTDDSNNTECECLPTN